MGLNSSMKKLVSYTSKLNNLLDFNKLLSVKVPGAKYTSLFGTSMDEGDGGMTLAEIAKNVGEIGGDIMTGVNLVNCAFIMSKGGMQGWKDFLGSMAMGVTSVILSLTDVILDAIAIQIGNAVSQIISTISSVISALYSIWTSILGILDALEELWDNWKTIKLDIDIELSKENCKDMYAAIAGCLLNKYLGPYLNEFKEKALNAINKYGNDFNNLLYEELSDARTFAAYASQEAFLLKKAELQIKGLTKENLLESMNL